MAKSNAEGRDENAAQPVGEREDAGSKSATERTAKAERKSAGPDGPSAKTIGDTFKR